MKNTRAKAGRLLDEACALAMGWKRDGAKWRRPGIITCASGANASTLTHERVHRKVDLPRFSSDSSWLATMLQWLRERDGFHLEVAFVEYQEPGFRVQWPVGQGDNHDFAGETPSLAVALAVVEVAAWQADGGGRED